MIYLLDSDTCIRYINGRSSSIRRRLRAVPRRDVALCDVVKSELYYGAYKSSRTEQNLTKLATFFSEFVVSLPFDGRAAERGGQIRAQLARLGTPIGHYDFLIAAIALANNLTLVTHNTREFSRVAGLRIEDWETDS